MVLHHMRVVEKTGEFGNIMGFCGRSNILYVQYGTFHPEWYPYAHIRQFFKVIALQTIWYNMAKKNILLKSSWKKARAPQHIRKRIKSTPKHQKSKNKTDWIEKKIEIDMKIHPNETFYVHNKGECGKFARNRFRSCLVHCRQKCPKWFVHLFPVCCFHVSAVGYVRCGVNVLLLLSCC